MLRYEYTIVHHSGEGLDRRLTQMGEKGWRFCVRLGRTAFIMERQKPRQEEMQDATSRSQD